MMRINFKICLILFLGIFMACHNQNKTPDSKKITTESFQNKGHELLYNMVQKVGNHSILSQKKDVVYTYTYLTSDGKKDVSTEKYIFDGELSYGLYNPHERTLPNLTGPIEQGYDGEEYWFKHNGTIINDSTILKRVAFNRPTNYYWFAMFQKLLDPGLIYEYKGEKEIEGNLYDIVSVSFTPVDNKPTDIYQVYINRQTSLVDQFLFTVADFGVMDEPLLMKVEYEEVENILVPSQRKYQKSTWNADISEGPWTEVIWSDIKFDNGLTIADFKK